MSDLFHETTEKLESTLAQETLKSVNGSWSKRFGNCPGRRLICPLM